MAIYEIGDDKIRSVPVVSFGEAHLRERSDLQRLLRDQVEVVAPDVLVIAEEFGHWTESRLRIDLLGVDKTGAIVVIELKRTEDGGHMELQAVRYAAMVSTLTAERAVEVFDQYLKSRDRDEDAEELLLEFLEWDELDEDHFAQDVRIVLVSADFSRELTTAVMWLLEKDLDIRCVRIRPYDYDGHVLIDVQQVLPLPEAADYQVQVREKKRQERRARSSTIDFTRYDVTVNGETHTNQWKRNAILIIVKALINSGVRPTEIQQVLRPSRGGNVFRTVDGETTDPDEFNRLATADAEANGRRYVDGRWHTKEGDIFADGGKSYALSNQWGRTWPQSMEALKKHYASYRVEFRPTGETD